MDSIDGVRTRPPSHPVLSARDMASRIVEALRHNTRGEMSCRFGRGDCVAIEDVSDLRGKPATLVELGRVIARLRAASVSLDGQSLLDLSWWCNGDIRRAVGAIEQLAFHASVVASR